MSDVLDVMLDDIVWEDVRTGGRKEGGRSGYSTKNKNPTRQCGEIGNL